MTVEYWNARHKQYDLKYTLSLDIFAKLTFAKVRTLHHMAKDFQSLSRALRRIIGIKGLKILARGADYETWSDRWQKDHGGDFASLGNPYPAGTRSPTSTTISIPRRPVELARHRQHASAGEQDRATEKRRWQPAGEGPLDPANTPDLGVTQIQQFEGGRAHPGGDSELQLA